MAAAAAPYVLKIPESALVDLRERLARTRFPDEPPLEPWSTGTSLAHLRDLVGYWGSGFDWRAHENTLNGFTQHKVSLAGIDLHFIHQRGGPIPLLLLHGWPGSVWEFHRLIPRLAAHFTVIAPSLPGFTLSFTPGQRRFGTVEMAEVFAELMSLLGYRRFCVQGGDWGASIATRMGFAHPGRLIGIHLNMLTIPRDPNLVPATPEETAYLAQLRNFMKDGMGYQWIQGTRPQTLAYGLTDSPAGLLAWIAEKFRAWSDTPPGRDDLLANTSLYWFTGAIGSSFWPYYARMQQGWPIPDGRTIDVPAGYAEFPKEILSPPRSLAAKTYTRLQRWTRMEKGGHFAALEQPAALAAEIEQFFRPLAG
jgi:pimeloyl-ACP methyl ester carboxylesterase